MEHLTTIGDSLGVMIEAKGQPIGTVTASRVLELLRTAGVVALRGFSGVGVHTFADFTDDFGVPLGLHHGGAHTAVPDSPRTRRVSSGNGPVDFHSENAGSPTRPDFLWFCCLKPPAAGGQTTLVDGSQVLASLDPPVRDAFERRRLKYGPVRFPAEQWKQMVGTDDADRARSIVQRVLDACLDSSHEQVSFDIDAAGDLRGSYLTNAIVRSPLSNVRAFANSLRGPYPMFPSFDDDTEIPSSIVEHVLAVEDRLCVEWEWQESDILAIDNWRVMHGRRAFSEGEDRVILHRMGGPRCAVSALAM
jgi:alpha-ketoglutarate-dependent taurine dioxygenase